MVPKDVRTAIIEAIHANGGTIFPRQFARLLGIRIGALNMYHYGLGHSKVGPLERTPLQGKHYYNEEQAMKLLDYLDTSIRRVFPGDVYDAVESEAMIACAGYAPEERIAHVRRLAQTMLDAKRSLGELRYESVNKALLHLAEAESYLEQASVVIGSLDPANAVFDTLSDIRYHVKREVSSLGELFATFGDGQHTS